MGESIEEALKRASLLSEVFPPEAFMGVSESEITKWLFISQRLSFI